MTSAKLDVAVVDGGQTVETVTQRPVRLMPTNVAGVVYGGWVYPLYSPGAIDLGDDPVDKSACATFVDAGRAVPFARRAEEPLLQSGALVSRWYVESNRFGHYLVFDGAPGTATKVVRAMEDAGLGVIRWDASHRPADNGESYDWFIRMGSDDTRERVVDRVAAALGAGGKASMAKHNDASSHDGTGSDLHLTTLRLQAEVNALYAENLQLQTAALVSGVESRAALTALERERDDARRKHQLALDRAKSLKARAAAETERAESVIATMREEILALQIAGASSEESHRRVQAADREKNHAVDSWMRAEKTCEDLQEERDFVILERDEATEEVAALRSTLDDALDRARELEHESGERARVLASGDGTTIGSAETLISRLLPRTDLDADSLDQLLSWSSPGCAMRLLQEVDDGKFPANHKSVQGKRGWWEVAKVNTGVKGRESLGRLYFAPHPGGRVQAVLHDKRDDKEQARFLAQLSDVT